MTVVVVVFVVGMAGWLLLRRARRRVGASVERSFTVEPPAGRMGKLKRSRL